MIRVAAAASLVAAVALACDGEQTDAVGSSGDGAAGDGAAGGERALVVEDADRLRGRAPPAKAGIPAIVTFTPRSLADSGSTGPSHDVAHTAAPAREGTAVVDQFGLAFAPRVLIAERGAPIRFTNSEGAITHNVHLRSISGDSTVFDDDTGPSEGVDVDLPGIGGYDVLCDMHPGMTGFVFVTEAPYAVVAGTDGRFEMDPVPAGEYVARIWTVDGWSTDRVVTLPLGAGALDLSGG